MKFILLLILLGTSAQAYNDTICGYISLTNWGTYTMTLPGGDAQLIPEDSRASYPSERLYRVVEERACVTGKWINHKTFRVFDVN